MFWLVLEAFAAVSFISGVFEVYPASLAVVGAATISFLSLVVSLVQFQRPYSVNSTRQRKMTKMHLHVPARDRVNGHFTDYLTEWPFFQKRTSWVVKTYRK